MVDHNGKGWLSDYVRSMMRRKGLTLRDIERKSGGKITDGYVSGIINGEATNLTVEKLKALAAGLGVEASDLFEAACGKKDHNGRLAETVDPSHSLMVLALMQKVVVSPDLTEILQELVHLSPDDRRNVLKMIKTLNETRSGKGRSRGAA